MCDLNGLNCFILWWEQKLATPMMSPAPTQDSMGYSLGSGYDPQQAYDGSMGYDPSLHQDLSP